MGLPDRQKSVDQPVLIQNGHSSANAFFHFIFARPLKDYLWVLLFVLWIGSFTLGYIGLSKSNLLQGVERSPLDLIYLDLQLVTLESGTIPGPVPWELEVARFALPALAAYTALQALAILFRDQAQVVRLWFMRDHVVICGLSRKGLLLAKNLLVENRKVVVIELDEGNDLIEQLRVRGAIVVTGDATDPEVLRRASVMRARYLIAVCGDDGSNAEIAVQAQNLIDGFGRDPLTCIIHMVDPRLCELLREKELGGIAFPGLRLELFNVYERGAQIVLEEYPPFEVDGQELGTSPHVLLIGMGKMGESLVARLAYAWHLNDQNSTDPLRVSVIDLQAEEKLARLGIRYPHLAACCNFSPISMDVTSSRFYDAYDLFGSDGRGVDIAYICFDHDSLGLNVGLTLSRLRRGREIPIVVRMVEERGLAFLLSKGKEDGGTFSNLHVFNLLDKTCTTELLFGGMHEMLARSVHEDYVHQLKGSGSSEDENGNLVPWDQLPEKVKDSNRRYADHISIKLKAVDCYLVPLQDWDATGFQFKPPEVEIMAEMEHERWVKERRREGWTYGEERDDNRKVHPSLVTWENLPESEKEKDRNSIRDLPHVLARIGFQIQRPL
jgi:hypothetical protein